MTTSPELAVYAGNAEAATVAIPVRCSPYIGMTGLGWNTAITNSDQKDWRMYNLPSSGATTASALKIDSRDNGGAWKNQASISDSGMLTVSNLVLPFSGSNCVIGVGSYSSTVGVYVVWGSVTNWIFLQ
jgi:hypothetical protein